MSEWTEERARVRALAQEEISRFATILADRLLEDERKWVARGGDGGMGSWLARIVDETVTTFGATP